MRFALIVLGAIGVGALIARQACADEFDERIPVVLQVRLDKQAITPVVARFVERAIRQAERERAECLIIVLDTPGGLLDSTRAIVKNILDSEVPIVVYIAPSGGRAGAAGMFVTMSAHVAVMAPGTYIGGAQPAQAFGLPGGAGGKNGAPGDQADPFQEKIVNDTVAWARALAQGRGRNAEWAVRAVKESSSATAKEAVERDAIDFLADNMAELLTRLDDREVKLARRSVRLHTADAMVRTIDMGWGERFLNVLANPTLAILLLILGFYGIVFEFITPGWGVSGTLGVIGLVLGFIALAVLPISFLGLALILGALAMFGAEPFVRSYGFLAIVGVLCLMLGGVMLVESPAGFQGVSLGVLGPMALGTAGITVFLVSKIVTAHRARTLTGADAMTGMTAVAQADFGAAGEAYTGLVFVRGELWKASSTTPVNVLETVEVMGREGLTLRVRPVTPTKRACRCVEDVGQ